MKTPKVTLKPEFKMTQEEIEKYKALPDNMPDNKLTAKQINFVYDLYRRYIGQTIDNQDWSTEMYKVEKREKWPSGPRVKDHEAMRFILNNLVWQNETPEMTPTEAALKFHSAMSCRPMYIKLIQKIYNTDALRK